VAVDDDDVADGEGAVAGGVVVVGVALFAGGAGGVVEHAERLGGDVVVVGVGVLGVVGVGVAEGVAGLVADDEEQ